MAETVWPIIKIIAPIRYVGIFINFFQEKQDQD